jgi:hypothetical protein
MNLRAFLFDLARTQRPTLPQMKSLVDDLAELGYNMMTINLEHRFDFPSRPGIAPPGSMTAAMARELVAYGAAHGVAVVGQPNLIGHCEGIGATERYAHLSTDPWQQAPWGGYEQLNLQTPDGRDMAKAMLMDTLDAFPGEYVHIGGDEVRRMADLFPAAPERRVPAMLDQFRYVLDLARGAGRQVMMWGDMPLHHEELMRALPRDVIICDWRYGPAGSRETLERYRREGFRVLAAPSTGAHAAFCTAPDHAAANIARMVGDARELALEGFLLTQWEAGFGGGFDLTWPWTAYAAEIAAGKPERTQDEFLAAFGAARYGLEGRDFARLHLLLSRDLTEAVKVDGVAPSRCGVTLRKALFRGADPFPHLARPPGIPPNNHQQVWEPSPFHAWLYLRPIMNGQMIERFESIAREAGALADSLERSVRHRAGELQSLLTLARAFGILVERVRILDDAKVHYHAAAVAQGRDAPRFREGLDRCAAALDRVRPGLRKLRAMVERLDSIRGLDPGEIEWLRIHETSLDAHLAALRGRGPGGDWLIEFGEFLRRPAHLTPRLTWR